MPYVGKMLLLEQSLYYKMLVISLDEKAGLTYLTV